MYLIHFRGLSVSSRAPQLVQDEQGWLEVSACELRDTLLQPIRREPQLAVPIGSASECAQEGLQFIEVMGRSQTTWNPYGRVVESFDSTIRGDDDSMDVGAWSWSHMDAPSDPLGRREKLLNIQ